MNDLIFRKFYCCNDNLEIGTIHKKFKSKVDEKNHEYYYYRYKYDNDIFIKIY